MVVATADMYFYILSYVFVFFTEYGMQLEKVLDSVCMCVFVMCYIFVTKIKP